MRRNQDLKSIATAAQLACVVGFVGILYVARDVLIPLSLGVLVAFLLTPVVNRLQRWGCGNLMAVAITSGVVVAVITLSVMLLVSNLSQLTSDVPRYKDELLKKASSVRDYGRQLTAKFAKLSADFSADLNSNNEKKGEEYSQSVTGNSSDVGNEEPRTADKSENPGSRGSDPKEPLFVEIASDSMLTVRSWAGSAGAILGPVGTLGLVLVFALFLLIYRDDLRDRFVATISRGNYVVSTEALQEASSRISRYLLAQFILNVSYGLLFSVGLMLVGKFLAPDGRFPNALLLGGLAGLFRFVPYAGPLVGASFPILIAIAIFPGYQVLVAVILMIVVMELLSNNVVEPLVYGSSTGVSSIAVILAAVFWGTLWGPVGLLLATPLTVCLVVLGTYVPRFKVFATLLSDSQQIAPDLRIFQRLIAGDSHKLREILKAEKASRTTEAFLDEIVVPTCQRVVRSGLRDNTNDLGLIELFSEAIDEIGLADPKDLSSTSPETHESSSITPVDQRPPKGGCYAIAANPGADQLLLRGISHLLADDWEIRTVAAAEFPDDVATEIAEKNPQLVLIVSIQLQGGRQLGYWCKTLRKAKYSGTIMVLLPSKLRDYDAVYTRLRKTGANFVMTSIRQIIRRMQLQVPSPK